MIRTYISFHSAPSNSKYLIGDTGNFIQTVKPVFVRALKKEGKIKIRK